MAFNPFTIIKSLLIKEEGTLTPKQIEVVPGGTAGTKTTLVGGQTLDQTLTLPDATDTLLAQDAAQPVNNKTIDADLNTITNLEDENIKVGAAINAEKIHDGSVSNTEFGYLNGVTSAIQTQLNTNASDISNHINDTTDAHDASAISVVPSGNLTSTDVQAGLVELQTQLDTVETTANNAANKTLSNLTSPTAVNQDILPDADGTRDLGSATLEFAQAHVNQILSATDLLLNPTNDVDVNNKVVKNVPAPTLASHAANKEYVDSVAAGLDPKEAVRVATTTSVGGSYATTPSNGRFTGAATTIDSVALSTGDRVLIKDQVDQKQNGIYVYDGAGQFTRSADMDGSPASEVSAGNYTFATQGTVNSSSGFVLTGNGIFTLNTDNLVFTQFSGSGGASRFLDNLLSPTAINQALLPDSNNSRDLGSSSLKFKDVYTAGNVLVDGNLTSTQGQTLDINTQTAPLNSASDNIVISSGAASGLGNSGQVQILSGNGGPASGNVVIQTGTGSSRGDVTLNARSTQVTSGALNITQGQTAVAVSNQQSVTVNSSGADEGLFKTTASDSSQRVILTASSTGLPQAPNLVANGDAEGKLTSSSTIFTAYADAAQSSPVDGTGGTPNVTSSVISAGALSGNKSYSLVKDAANRQGQGWTIDLSVPAAYRARVLSVKFDYIVGSGTFVAGTSTTDSDVTVWIYDVTNSTLIQPSSYKLLSNSTSNVDQFQAEFQTSGNGTTYRLIFHVSTTSGSAYTLNVDNIVVSPSEYVFGSPVSDWQSYTPTLTGFGTATGVDFKYRRVGSDIEIQGYFTSGTPTATQARVSLPSGATVSSVVQTTPNNHWGQYIRQVGAGTTEKGGVLLPVASQNYFVFSSVNTFGAASTPSSLSAVNADTITGSGTLVSLSIKVPVAGASSSVQMADQTSTRQVSFQAFKNGGTGGANTTLATWTTVQKDTHAAFNASTGVYTVPVAGDYQVGGSIGTTASTGIHNIYLNGTAVIRSGSSGQASSFGIIPNCKVGDQITIALESALTLLSANTNTFTISRISGPSQIASSETVAAKYTIGTGASTTLNTPFNYDTREFDTHSSVTTGAGTWNFRAPVGGIYQVSAKAYSGADFILRLYKNSTLQEILTTVTTADGTHCGSTLIQLNAGDTVDVRPNATVTPTGQGGSTVAQANSVCIQRIGLRG